MIIVRTTSRSMTIRKYDEYSGCYNYTVLLLLESRSMTIRRKYKYCTLIAADTFVIDDNFCRLCSFVYFFLCVAESLNCWLVPTFTSPKTSPRESRTDGWNYKSS